MTSYIMLADVQEVFGQQLRALDPFRELPDEDVRTAIKNSSGVAGDPTGSDPS
jgi:hypothetical protein